MSTPASERAEEFLRRIFPEAPSVEGSRTTPDADTTRTNTMRTDTTRTDGNVRGVDERRQQLLEPIGDPDREPW